MGPIAEKFVEIPFLEPEMLTSPDIKLKNLIIRTHQLPVAPWRLGENF
jgi:hypothetical protein